MPTPITDKINEIIDRRLGRGQWEGKGRLQQIQRAEANLEVLRQKINSLNELLGLIEHQKQEQRGDYYAMLQKNPSMEEKLKNVSSSEVIKNINLLQEEIDLLKKRFSRETVQIAMIGRERQGKSTLIQSITGLGNEVIPAFDGSSCTGTVSVIHNSEGEFHADLTFFERGEFLESINKKLSEFFPGEGYYVTSLEQLGQLKHSLKDKTLNSDAETFRNNFINHCEDYCMLIGSAPISLKEKSVVAQYVAQYQLFDSRELCPTGFEVVQRDPDKNGVVKYAAQYYKYLAVKSVNIYTPFEYPDSGKLVLVDTIGIGQANNTDVLLNEMYRVVREDADGAIDVFRPDPLGTSVNDEQVSILKGIKTQFDDRHPEKWFIYIINKVLADKGYNADKVGQILADAERLRRSNDVAFAWAKVINCGDPKEVIDQLVIPQLNLITENIEDIDACMMKSAQKKADALYNEYSMLCKSVNSVLSSSFKNDQNIMHLFDDLYENLELRTAMNSLDTAKFKEQEKPCEEIAAELEAITEEKIFDIWPEEEKEKILKAVREGIHGGKIFLDEIDEFRNRIFEIYENVNIEHLHPLQEGVKMEMIELFYNEGLLKKIPLTSYEVSNGPSVEWLAALVEETIDKETYPQIYNALRLILDYQINIEGLIEYNVARSVHLINPKYGEFHQIPFVPLPATHGTEEQADHIYNEIYYRISHIQEQMRAWIDDFSMIPSHSFYARVDKVWEKLFHSEDGQAQLRYYYLDNVGTIWSEEISSIAQVQNAFGGWNEMCKELNSLLDKRNFEI